MQAGTYGNAPVHLQSCYNGPSLKYRKMWFDRRSSVDDKDLRGGKGGKNKRVVAELTEGYACRCCIRSIYVVRRK